VLARPGLPIRLVDNEGGYSVSLVADMCAALWQGQQSRHRANGYRKPNQEETEAAVLLAVPLLQWFTTRQIARRPVAP
jgi:hypothetical protein